MDLQVVVPGNTQAQEMRVDDSKWMSKRGTVSAMRNLYFDCCSREYKITKLGIYCKDVPVYIANEKCIQSPLQYKTQAYQPIGNVHQATGAYQYHIVGETPKFKIRTAIRHIQP